MTGFETQEAGDHTAASKPGFAHRGGIKSELLTWDRAVAVVSDGIFVIDAQQPDFPVLDCNPAFESITGYTRKEARGRSCLFMIGPDTDAGAIQQVRDALRTAGSCNVVIEQYRKDGEPFSSEMTLAPARNASGVPTHMVGVLHDITERRKAEEALRRSEQRFRTAFELGPAAASITTLGEGRFVDVNRSFTRMLGYSRDEVLGRTAAEIGLLADPAERIDYDAALRQDGRFRHIQHRVRAAAGTYHIILISAALVWVDESEHVLSLFSDLSPQVRLERELLRISEEERRRIGHDLHDSLGSRFTGIAMLSQGLAAAARRGETIAADDLEDIARLAGEGTEKTRALSRGLNPVGLDERSLEAALQQLTSDAWTISRTACNFVADASLPELGDEVKSHLYRIAQEALNNALKHAGAQHIGIRLTRAHSSLVLAVSDDGRGLSESRNSEAGMGLRIMRYRADLIGASLKLESPPGGGTIVRCTYHLDQGRSNQIERL